MIALLSANEKRWVALFRYIQLLLLQVIYVVEHATSSRMRWRQRLGAGLACGQYHVQSVARSFDLGSDKLIR